MKKKSPFITKDMGTAKAKHNTQAEERTAIFGAFESVLASIVAGLRRLADNRQQLDDPSTIPPPTLLWQFKTNCEALIDAFADHVFAEYLLEYRKLLKIRIDYPGIFDVVKFNDIIQQATQHLKPNGAMPGIVAIDVTSWLRYSHEKQFFEFLSNIFKNHGKIMFIFYANTDNTIDISNLETTISRFKKVKALCIELPDTAKLLELMENTRLKNYTLQDCAKELLISSIDEIRNSNKNFQGLDEILLMAQDISADLLNSNIINGDVTAAMLAEYAPNSTYVEKKKKNIGNNSIGFNTSK